MNRNLVSLLLIGSKEIIWFSLFFDVFFFLNFAVVSSTAKPAMEHGDFVVKVDDKVCVRVTLKATFTVKYASLRSGKVGAFY